MNTLIVNIFGGPCTGKSTTAADVFAKLKHKHVNCEMALEYVKDKVWEDSLSILNNQIYVFGKQHHRLFRLQSKVDVVVCDAPILNTLIYASNDALELKMLVLKEHIKFNNLNIFLKRSKQFQEAGRLHTEVDAKLIDQATMKMLDDNEVSYQTMDVDAFIGEKIVDIICEKLDTSNKLKS